MYLSKFHCLVPTCALCVCGQGLTHTSTGPCLGQVLSHWLCSSDAWLVRVPVGRLEQGSPFHSGPKTHWIYSLWRMQGVPSFLLISLSHKLFWKIFCFQNPVLNFPMKLIQSSCASLPPCRAACVKAPVSIWNKLRESGHFSGNDGIL